MRYEFTPASERALAVAARWTCKPRRGELHPPEVLLGLLAEEECRAAQMLDALGIDLERLHSRWPLTEWTDADVPRRSRQFSAELEASIAAAAARLSDYPKPLIFATEHLLLGLASAHHDLSCWLAEHGLVADELEAEIHRLYGYTIADDESELDPLPADLLEEAATPAAPRDPAFPPEHPATRPTETIDGTWSRADGMTRSGLSRLLHEASATARETLRVVQDFAEFVLADRQLASRLAGDREALLEALARCGTATAAHALESSNHEASAATALVANSGNAAAAAAANLARYQESLRSLEAYLRPTDPATAAVFERLRRASYVVFDSGATGELMGTNATINSAYGNRRRALLAAARLYVLLDGQADSGRLDTLATSLVAAGADILQLRDKSLEDRTLLERARVLCRVTRDTETLAIINDRPDLAALSEADGVHVGQEELAVADARRVVGPDALVGVSTHSLRQAETAEHDGADYVGVGPTFSSGTKQFPSLAGVALLREVAPAICVPAFAIGGITCENLPQVLSAGFRRVAVSSAVMNAPDPAEAVRRLRAMLCDGG